MEKELAELANNVMAEFKKNKEQNEQHIKPNQFCKVSTSEILPECQGEEQRDESYRRRDKRYGEKAIEIQYIGIGSPEGESGQENQNHQRHNGRKLPGADKRPETTNWKEFTMYPEKKN